MIRRDFVSLLGSVAVAWPLAARAQPPTMPVIGFLSARSPGESNEVIAAFREGLREAGFVATSTIPIVFSGAADPVRLGLVASLNRPGGNVTGMSLFTLTLVAKSVGLLHELVPTATVVTYLVNPSNPSARVETTEAQAAASALGIQLHVLNASTNEGLQTAFAGVVRLRAAGLVVPADAFFDSHRDRVVALSARHAVATISHGVITLWLVAL